MTPWPALLRLAATRFGIAPEGFWRLSLVEWRALTEEGPVGLSRRRFDELIAAWPD